MTFLSSDDLSSIEVQLGLVLPSHYKEFHLNSHELIQDLRNSDSIPDDDSMWVATDIESLIEYNRFSGIPKTEGPSRNKFYIGGDGFGGSVLIDLLDHDNTNVYFVSPDDFEEIFDESKDDFLWDSELVHAADSIPEFVKEKIRFNKVL